MHVWSGIYNCSCSKYRHKYMYQINTITNYLLILSFYTQVKIVARNQQPYDVHFFAGSLQNWLKTPTNEWFTSTDHQWASVLKVSTHLSHSLLTLQPSGWNSSICCLKTRLWSSFFPQAAGLRNSFSTLPPLKSFYFSNVIILILWLYNVILYNDHNI